MTLTVLRWARRHRCQRCGARSKGRGLAGDMVATPDGWLCPTCLSGQMCISPARDIEPAPRYGAIGAGDAPGAAA